MITIIVSIWAGCFALYAWALKREIRNTWKHCVFPFGIIPVGGMLLLVFITSPLVPFAFVLWAVQKYIMGKDMEPFI